MESDETHKESAAADASVAARAAQVAARWVQTNQDEEIAEQQLRQLRDAALAGLRGVESDTRGRNVGLQAALQQRQQQEETLHEFERQQLARRNAAINALRGVEGATAARNAATRVRAREAALARAPARKHRIVHDFDKQQGCSHKRRYVDPSASDATHAATSTAHAHRQRASAVHAESVASKQAAAVVRAATHAEMVRLEAGQRAAAAQQAAKVFAIGLISGAVKKRATADAADALMDFHHAAATAQQLADAEHAAMTDALRRDAEAAEAMIDFAAQPPPPTTAPKVKRRVAKKSTTMESGQAHRAAVAADTNDASRKAHVSWLRMQGARASASRRR